MVKIEPLEPSEPTKFEFLEYLDQYHGLSENVSMDYLYNNYYNNFTDFQSIELQKSFFEDFFEGDWRKGKEICKVVINQRLYQISPSSTQAWFWKSKFVIIRPEIQIFNKIEAFELFDQSPRLFSF